MEHELIKLLLVEDSFTDVLILKELLRVSGLNFKIDQVSELKAAKEIIRGNKFDIILLDLGLPDSYGIDTFYEINKVAPYTPINILTGNDDEEIALNLVKNGAQDYLIKANFDSGILCRSIKYSIERKKSEELQIQNLFRLELLSETTQNINECDDIPSVHHIICDSLCKLIPNIIIIVAETIGDKSLSIINSGGIEKYFEKLNGVIDIKSFLKSEFNIENIFNILRINFKSYKLKKYTGTFSELTFNKLPKDICSEIEKILDFNFIYNIGFEWNEKYFCAISLFCKTEILNENINIIETIISQASLKINRKKMEQNLLQTIAENEEKQLAKFAADLHDGLGPLVSTAKYYIKAFEYCKTEEEKALTFTNIGRSLDEATIALKELSENLSPHILINLGLITALKKYCDKFNNSEILINIETNIETRLNEIIEICIYRVIVELINNTLKHAKASNITIMINKDVNHLIVEYSDNGVGFDFNSLIKSNKGRGLQNIISRVTTFNGNCIFEDNENCGTKVKIVF